MQAHGEGSTRRAPRTVLVVDDDPGMRDLLTAVVSSVGCQALAVGDGVEALAVLEALRPEVVLLDVVMPGLDGIEVLRRMRAARGLRDVPVIILSNRGALEDRVEGLDSGATDYLRKPFETDEVASRLRRSLREAESVRDRVRLEREAALGELAVAVCHELNNPLTVVLGELHNALVRSDASEIQTSIAVAREHAGRMRTALARIARARDETTEYVQGRRMIKL